ncbi:MAG: hypothetical protein JNL38_05555 [Myxococcales bacterium]|nr:hypothetical protein [Myxococcales bacterium]
MAGKRPPTPLDPERLSALADAVVVAVREAGFVARAKLGALGIAPAHRDAVLAEVARRGLEVDRRGARTPLAAQLRARVEAGAVPLAQVAKHVAGASAKEAAAAARALCDAGQARLVVRTKALVLVSATEPSVDAEELARLERAMRALGSALSLARRKKASLLRDDVLGALGPFVARRAEPSRAGGVDALLGAIDAARDATGLSFVPAVVRSLGGPPAAARVHAALLEAAKAQRVELRPESGMGRLSPEDLALCLPGPQGSLLSWVRKRGGP